MANQKNLKPWPKGKSGNPKGRPKKAETFVEFRAVILDFLNEPSTRNKIRLMRQMEMMSRTTAGIKVIWQYAFGNPPVRVDVAGEVPQDFLERWDRTLEAVYGKHVEEKSST